MQYTVQLGRSRTVRRSRYADSKALARLLAGQLGQLEEATRNGLAPRDEVQAWVSKGWLTDAEAAAIFPGFAEVLAQQRQLAATDYPRLLLAFERFWMDKSDRDVRGKNLGSDMSHARHIVNWLAEHAPSLGQLTAEGVQQYLRELKEQEYADNTIKNRLNLFRQLLDQAAGLDMLADNPARKVNLRQVSVRLRGAAEERRILRDEEIPLLFEVAARQTAPLSGCLATVVHLGLYAGLRNAEMCWLRWEAIDWANRIITVKESTCEETGDTWKPKDYEIRRLDVKPACIDHLAALRERLEREEIQSPFVIPGGSTRQPHFRRRPLHQDAPQKAFGKMMVAAALDPAITVYSLRHTYATMALRAGVDLRTLQKRMGHSDIKTTMEYLHYIEPEAHPMDRLPY